jgi:hypothetical protein
MEYLMQSANYLRLFIAFVIMISAAIYQRKTGPTHPVDVEYRWKSAEIEGQLTRSHNGKGDQQIEITVSDSGMQAVLIHRRFKTNDEWTGMKMKRSGDLLQASLPHQPPAGKLEYFIQLNKGEEIFNVPQERMVVTRFTGYVPDLVLYPHIVIMFFAMLLSTWAGLEAAFNDKKMARLTYWTTLLLFLGGMILGPIVQKFAFGEFWTGVPFGWDLTDNKTLVAMIAWIWASWTVLRDKSMRLWIIIAAFILLVVYSIPHSVMGSELNYKTMEIDISE